MKKYYRSLKYIMIICLVCLYRCNTIKNKNVTINEAKRIIKNILNNDNDRIFYIRNEFGRLIKYKYALHMEYYNNIIVEEDVPNINISKYVLESRPDSKQIIFRPKIYGKNINYKSEEETEKVNIFLKEKKIILNDFNLVSKRKKLIFKYLDDLHEGLITKSINIDFIIKIIYSYYVETFNDSDLKFFCFQYFYTPKNFDNIFSIILKKKIEINKLPEEMLDWLIDIYEDLYNVKLHCKKGAKKVIHSESYSKETISNLRFVIKYLIVHGAKLKHENILNSCITSKYTDCIKKIYQKKQNKNL